MLIIFQSDDHSPNGSCLSSAQTIHSHPPAKTVSIVEHYTQVQSANTSTLFSLYPPGYYILLFWSRPIFQWLLIYLLFILWPRSISSFLLSIKLILSFLLYKLLHIFTKKRIESQHDLCRSATPKQARLIFLGVRVSSRCPSAQTRLLTALPTSLS